MTLAAANSNTVQLGGGINVSGLGPGQTGGTANVTGGAVNLTSTANIDARGAVGGGRVAVRASSAGSSAPAAVTYGGQPVSGATKQLWRASRSRRAR